MTEYDNTNRGVLFKNNKKTKDTQPTHTGSINVEGEEYFLSAWVKESKNGNKFFSLSIKAKEDKPVTKADVQKTFPDAEEEMDDSIPF